MNVTMTMLLRTSDKLLTLIITAILVTETTITLDQCQRVSTPVSSGAGEGAPDLIDYSHEVQQKDCAQSQSGRYTDLLESPDCVQWYQHDNGVGD